MELVFFIPESATLKDNPLNMMFKIALFTAVLGTVLVSASPQVSPRSPGVPGLADPCTCLHSPQVLP